MLDIHRLTCGSITPMLGRLRTLCLSTSLWKYIYVEFIVDGVLIDSFGVETYKYIQSAAASSCTFLGK